MVIYKVHFHTHRESSCGFNYFLKRKEAKARLLQYKKDNGKDYNKHMCRIEKIEFKMNVAEIISLLNVHGGHNDNG